MFLLCVNDVMMLSSPPPDSGIEHTHTLVKEGGNVCPFSPPPVLTYFPEARFDYKNNTSTDLIQAEFFKAGDIKVKKRQHLFLTPTLTFVLQYHDCALFD